MYIQENALDQLPNQGYWITTIYPGGKSTCEKINTPDNLTRIDNSVYITQLAFSHYRYDPAAMAGLMIHEATHAWQEETVRQNLPAGEKFLDFLVRYQNGMERQAIEVERNAIRASRISAWNLTRFNDVEAYAAQKAAGDPFPYQLIGTP